MNNSEFTGDYTLIFFEVVKSLSWLIFDMPKIRFWSLLYPSRQLTNSWPSNFYKNDHFTLSVNIKIYELHD
jgi:hypothetical protein